MVSLKGETNRLIEWEYLSEKSYHDPFNEIELDIHITSPSGTTWCIPSFWRGGNRWAVRFIPKETGLYHIMTVCSDRENASLHNMESKLDVTASTQILPPKLNVDTEKYYLTDENGEPFFWFADTWWMALSKRLSFPQEFNTLLSRRKEQGFNVIMLVAGLFPDMDSFDPRGSNEAGFPWEAGYTRINPAYFDAADRRIAVLIEAGFIPSILGSWGYYLLQMGEEKMQQHWRYLIARWGCYPVVWCIAGEATMPYYLSKTRTEEMYALHEGWTRLAAYIRQTEPFGNLITIHPTEIGREQLQDPSLIDFNLIQSGHNDYISVKRTIELIREEKEREPRMPVILGEANYEGILKNTDPKMQRLTFWSAVLSGAKGYSYGANGVWQVNTKAQPFGPSPHGGSWGDTPWSESLYFHGASQLGLAKKLIENYPWWLTEPHQEWIIPQKNTYHYATPKAAGIPGKLRIIYFPNIRTYWQHSRYKIVNLENGVCYNTFFWNPRTAESLPIGQVSSRHKSVWHVPPLPTKEDWLLVMEAETEPVKENTKKTKTSLSFLHYFKHIWKQ